MAGPSVGKYLRYILKSLAGIVLFIAVYLLSAFVLSRITVDREPGGINDIAIFIKSNGVHTDIVVPVKTEIVDWSQEIKYSNTLLKDSTWQYVAFGWGDKGFYLQTPQWSDLKFSVAFKAAFGLSTSAIHATFYYSLHENEQCHKILISKQQYLRLTDYINASFNKKENHVQYIVTNANYGNSDAFYEANGKYNLFFTCNTWANNALKACGQKCCVWTIFDTGIFLKYR